MGGAVPAAWHLTAEVGMRRHRVVYRLVGGVYLMVVAAVQANVLWLLNLLDPCVRVLIGVAKSVEVTPDKLARRYPEVRLVLQAVHYLSPLFWHCPLVHLPSA